MNRTFSRAGSYPLHSSDWLTFTARACRAHTHDHLLSTGHPRRPAEPSMNAGHQPPNRPSPGHLSWPLPTAHPSAAQPYKDLFPTWKPAGWRWRRPWLRPPGLPGGPAYRRAGPTPAPRRLAPEGGRPARLAFAEAAPGRNNIQLGILNPTGDNGSSFQNRSSAGVASAMNRWVRPNG